MNEAIYVLILTISGYESSAIHSINTSSKEECKRIGQEWINHVPLKISNRYSYVCSPKKEIK